jgi:hypothetical protein
MLTTRPQWPHTIEDIHSSLDGIWGLVGATGMNGNLYRLERSLHQPLQYTLFEYEGSNESRVVNKQVFAGDDKQQAIREFAQALGFDAG